MEKPSSARLEIMCMSQQIYLDYCSALEIAPHPKAHRAVIEAVVAIIDKYHPEEASNIISLDFYRGLKQNQA